jgi:hypothetical protein
VSSVPNGWFYCGAWLTAPPEVNISLAKDVCGVVVPYLWSKGGRTAADGVWSILGGWADSRSGEGLVEEGASIALARIPIKPQPQDSFDVDRDQLIADVINPIARIGAKQAKAIASFVAGLTDSDEN